MLAQLEDFTTSGSKDFAPSSLLEGSRGRTRTTTADAWNERAASAVGSGTDSKRGSKQKQMIQKAVVTASDRNKVGEAAAKAPQSPVQVSLTNQNMAASVCGRSPACTKLHAHVGRCNKGSPMTSAAVPNTNPQQPATGLAAAAGSESNGISPSKAAVTLSQAQKKSSAATKIPAKGESKTGVESLRTVDVVLQNKTSGEKGKSASGPQADGSPKVRGASREEPGKRAARASTAKSCQGASAKITAMLQEPAKDQGEMPSKEVSLKTVQEATTEKIACDAAAKVIQEEELVAKEVASSRMNVLGQADGSPADGVAKHRASSKAESPSDQKQAVELASVDLATAQNTSVSLGRDNEANLASKFDVGADWDVEDDASISDGDDFSDEMKQPDIVMRPVPEPAAPKSAPKRVAKRSAAAAAPAQKLAKRMRKDDGTPKVQQCV